MEAPASGGSCKWRNEALSTFDDINNNKIICRYYDRDSRRNYPQTVEFTPSTLKELPIDPNATARTIKEASFKSQGFLDFKYQYKEGNQKLTDGKEFGDFGFTTQKMNLLMKKYLSKSIVNLLDF